MKLLDTNWTYPMNPKYEENETLSDAEGASISVVADFDYGFFAAGPFEQIATLYYAGYFDPDCTVVKTFDFPCAVSGEFSQDSLYTDGREYYALVSDDDYELKIDSLYVTIDEAEEALEAIGDGFRIETVVFYNEMMKTEMQFWKRSRHWIMMVSVLITGIGTLPSCTEYDLDERTPEGHG